MSGLWTAVLAAIVASLTSMTAASVVELMRARRKLRSAEEVEFAAALASDSLIGLGGYLETNLGPFLVTEYTRDSDVRKRVDLFLARVHEYLGSDEEFEDGSTRPLPPPPMSLDIDPDTRFELQRIQEKWLEGELWDALASLRRVIEVRLRALATARKSSVSARAGSGVLLETLYRQEVINEDTAQRLRFAIDVCNRAIHGLEVYVDESDEAIEQAAIALSALPRT